MTNEEAALVIDEQLVKLGRNRAGDAEPFGGPRDDIRQRFRPVLAADRDAPGLDLPLGLRRQQRQGNLADALDLDARCQQLGTTAREIIARTIDVAEYVRKFLRDSHGAPCRAVSCPRHLCPATSA